MKADKYQSVHVYFSGRVQGVGFRYTACSLALDYGLSGWVKNLPDGRVELLLQGGQDKISNFLGGIRERFSGFIMDEQQSSPESGDKLKSFTIEF